jgi:hypothetical protein
MGAMKVLALTALVAALLVPAAGYAQQTEQPAAAQQQAPATQQKMPGIYRVWSMLLRGIDLSNDQHDKIQNLLDQYAQAHPAGSARDPQAARQLRDQIVALLTSDQQTQFQQKLERMRERRQQRLRERQQMQQQQQSYPQQGAGYPQPAATP